MKYKGVIFDLDGTLVNTLYDLKNSCNYVMRKNGFPEHSYENIRSFIGNGIHKLIERACPMGTDSKIVEKCFNEMVAHYNENNCVESCTFDGIDKLLADLKSNGIKLAVLTNKIQSSTDKVVDYYLHDIFSIVQGDDGKLPLKPNTDGIDMIINSWSMKKNEVLYVGDSCVDTKTARNAGVDCVACKWGFCDSEVLVNEHTRYIVDNPSQIYDIVMGENL